MPIVGCLMLCNGCVLRMLILKYVRSALYTTGYMCGILVGKCHSVCVYVGVNCYGVMMTQLTEFVGLYSY
jgi:hypothetical protein